MYNKNIIKKATLIIAILVATTFGQLLMVENFSYTANSPLTNNGWTAHSGAGTNPILVYSPGLTYSGYVSSNIGNAAKVDTAGEDDNITFNPQTSGTVYTAFMMKVLKATTTGDYFFHLSTSPFSTYDFISRFHIKCNVSNSVALGLGKRQSDTTFSGFSYSLNTTYLVVLKYAIVAGDNNDQLSMFVFSSGVPSTEPPTPTIGPIAPASTDPANVGAVALRQGSAANAPRVIIDGIRIATTWSSAVSGIEENEIATGLLSQQRNDFVVYPNPFRVGKYNVILSNAKNLKGIKIYDAMGNLVKTLNNSTSSHLSWDARNSAGNLVAPGVYIVVLETAHGNKVAKVLLSK